MAIRAHSLAVTGVEPQGSDAILLSLGVTAEQQPHFGFRPGQYLTLAATVQGDDYWRCYSITSEPVVGQPISVLVRRVAGGRVSNWLCDHAQPGLRLQVLPPAGHFTLARPGQPVLLYAGGSGIAPVYALAREALAQGAARGRLFYANRDRATAMLQAELQTLQAAAAGRLEALVTEAAAFRGEVLPKRIPFGVILRHQNAAKVGVPRERNAHHVEHFPFEELCAAPDAGDRRERGVVLRHTGFHADPAAMRQ